MILNLLDTTIELHVERLLLDVLDGLALSDQISHDPGPLALVKDAIHDVSVHDVIFNSNIVRVEYSNSRVVVVVEAAVSDVGLGLPGFSCPDHMISRTNESNGVPRVVVV